MMTYYVSPSHDELHLTLTAIRSDLNDWIAKFRRLDEQSLQPLFSGGERGCGIPLGEGPDAVDMTAERGID